MNRLRSSQLFAMLFVSAAFSFLCQTTAFTIEGIFGAAIGILLQGILCLPVLLLYRSGFSLEHYARQHHILPLCLIVYLVLRGGISFVQLQHASGVLSLPVSGKFFAATLIALICVYTAALGIQALARSSTLILGVLLFTLVILFIGAIPHAEPQNLSLSPNDTVWRGFLREMSSADELPLLLLLLDFTESKRYRGIIQFLTGKLALLSFFTLLGMAVLGNRMAQANVPFFSIASVSQPLSTQRADALYIVVFVLLCILRITLFTALAAHLLQLTFPKIRYSSTVCLGIMLAVSAAAAAFPISAWWQIGALLLLMLPVPFFFLLLHKKGGTAA